VLAVVANTFAPGASFWTAASKAGRSCVSHRVEVVASGEIHAIRMLLSGTLPLLAPALAVLAGEAEHPASNAATTAVASPIRFITTPLLSLESASVEALHLVRLSRYGGRKLAVNDFRCRTVEAHRYFLTERLDHSRAHA
jgi:hypothetical protein